MSELTRPLADRIAHLPQPREWDTAAFQSEALVAGAIQALDEGKTKYTNRPGIVPLLQWVAQHINQTYGWALSPEDITITCGITEAEYVAMAYFLSRQSGAVLTADHTDDAIYAERIRPLARLLGSDVMTYEVDGAKMMQHLMQGKREPLPEDFIPAPEDVSLVYIGDPGVKSAALLGVAQERDLPVIWSTALNSNNAEIPAAVLPNTVLVGGLETALRGWRIGWMAGHSQHAKLRSYKQSMTICTPSVSQWAALAMVEAES